MTHALMTVTFHSLFEGFGEFLAIALITLAPHLRKWALKVFKKHSNYFVHNLNVRKKINDHLLELRIELNADRVCLFEFSNTDKSISQYPFEYLNMTYEKTSTSTAEMRDSWQKKHINPYIDFLHMFSDPHGDTSAIIHANDDRIPESVRLSLQAENIESCLVHKLHSELKHGFIAVHFINRRYQARWDLGGHAHQSRLRMKSHQILQLMKELQ